MKNLNKGLKVYPKYSDKYYVYALCRPNGIESSKDIATRLWIGQRYLMNLFNEFI